MSLSERLAEREKDRREAAKRIAERMPEWRRRQLERLAKVGRVAEKALDR